MKKAAVEPPFFVVRDAWRAQGAAFTDCGVERGEVQGEAKGGLPDGARSRPWCHHQRPHPDPAWLDCLFPADRRQGNLEELDGWLRRRLRCILWRQWKEPATRAMRLMQRGLTEQRACGSACNGRGPWWNAGASHMNDAFRKAFFDQLGLISLQQELRRLNNAS